MRFNWSDHRFLTEAEVPAFAFPVVPHDHPDLELIRRTYLRRGQALGIDYASRRVKVTLEVPATIKVIASFDTIAEAEDFLATSATIDPDDLEAGHYGIDAPEEMVNP